VQRSGRATFVDGADRYPVTIENVDHEAITLKVDEAYRAKYADAAESLRQMVSPAARAYTMRITLQ